MNSFLSVSVEEEFKRLISQGHSSQNSIFKKEIAKEIAKEKKGFTRSWVFPLILAQQNLLEQTFKKFYEENPGSLTGR